MRPHQSCLTFKRRDKTKAFLETHQQLPAWIPLVRIGLHGYPQLQGRLGNQEQVSQDWLRAGHMASLSAARAQLRERWGLACRTLSYTCLRPRCPPHQQFCASVTGYSSQRARRVMTDLLRHWPLISQAPPPPGVLLDEK